MVELRSLLMPSSIKRGWVTEHRLDDALGPNRNSCGMDHVGWWFVFAGSEVTQPDVSEKPGF